jgi:riboflavin kinase/FMN adenylyltransferase
VHDVLVGRLKAPGDRRRVQSSLRPRRARRRRLLESLAGPLGFRAHVVKALMVDGVAVSSSEIRVGAAARRSARRGAPARATLFDPRRGGARRRTRRTLGFPTANIKTDGRWGCRSACMHAGCRRRDRQHQAVRQCGFRPTFGVNELAVEAHVLDFTGDLYDQRVTLTFVAAFGTSEVPNVDALRQQIALDVAAARAAS